MVPQYLDLVAGPVRNPRWANRGKALRIEAWHPVLGGNFLQCDGAPPLLFTENDTNNERLFGTPNTTPYVKDGINEYVVAGRQDADKPQPDRNKSRRAL